jgi:hypothetical protein
MKSFTIRLIALSVFFAVASMPHRAKASVAGASLTYTHLAGNIYTLRLTLYRDCAGIGAPPWVLVNALSVNCAVNIDYNLLPVAGTGTEITLPCAGTFTNCTGGSGPGFQKWEYEQSVAITHLCTDWIFSYASCCRTGGTVQAGSTLYVEARLDNSTADNSSPQFTNDPVLFACMNRDIHFNNGMYDADGDSLVYHLTDAIGAVYVFPYTGQQPVTSVPPVTCDSFTGDFFMHPAAIESGPVVFEIREYRNGVMVGSVLREVNVYTVPCNDNMPAESGMNGTSQQILYVLPGDTACFDIFSDDLDTAEALTMTWNNTIPAAAFSTAGSPHPTGTFCWTPSPADVRSQPYMFTSVIRDNCCPANNTGTYSFFIYVTLDSSLVLNNNAAIKNPLFIISPNPATGIFTFRCDEKFSLLKIYNQSGECILNGDFASPVDLSDQPSGVYFIKAMTFDGKVITQKLLLNHIMNY